MWNSCGNQKYDAIFYWNYSFNLGISIIVFDYSQIQIFEKMGSESYYLLDEESRNVHQRLIIEFSIGVVILGLGMVTLLGSMLKRFENGLRTMIFRIQPQELGFYNFQ